jgi:hypothetical protein
MAAMGRKVDFSLENPPFQRKHHLSEFWLRCETYNFLGTNAIPPSSDLDGSVQDEFHELVLHAAEGGVEAHRHLTQVCRDVGTEVLHKAPVPARGKKPLFK